MLVLRENLTVCVLKLCLNCMDESKSVRCVINFVLAFKQLNGREIPTFQKSFSEGINLLNRYKECWRG